VEGPNATPIPPVILIGLEVLDRITADAARYAGKSERGGIFIGLRRGPHIEINEATLPMRWDLGSMFAFRRSSRGHQSVALRRWRDSARTMDWVGEWHSHPQSIPAPSSIDLGSWKGITADRDAPMVFLIIGYAALWVGLSVPWKRQPIKYVEAERSPAGIAFKPE
jgi:integrative and conjugative element protein (TIGR02256 family)